MFDARSCWGNIIKPPIKKKSAKKNREKLYYNQNKSTEVNLLQNITLLCFSIFTEKIKLITKIILNS